ncbi:MAG: hypothetical protein ABS55_03775 [Lautropia sp. SCN 70-15]|nr:MAG: hypothetical protein ABS55_03775 [Lautropia sp. SCN 70-15]
MTRRIGRLPALLIAALVAGCAMQPRPPSPQAPLLKLPPAALGYSLSQHQQLTVEAPGRQPQRAEVLLEVDAEVVRLALLSMGRTTARLEWDGHRLHQQRAPWWPVEMSGERVLSELQLSLWPVEAIRTALPEGWSLLESGNQRSLWWHGQAVILVRRDTRGGIEFAHLVAGYRLLIEVLDLEAAP